MTDEHEKPLILVVDDTPENVDVLAGVLGDEYRIRVALDGPKGLEIANSDPRPDLILLDVMMPGMDGYEVCRRLKENPDTRDTPVIFVTARHEVEDETHGLEIGAVDYITKPISPTVVKARVRAHLALKESREKLAGLSDKLSRYLSPQVYRSIFEGRQDARIGGKRKRLTIFLSDIVGFTSQTESMEPEDLSFVLNGYLNRMAQLVLEHGGTLDKFIGDAVLAFFGDPESQGAREDATACVGMALAMREAGRELAREWAERGIARDFRIRTGITTGYCTVGNFGSDQRMDYTVIGGQVNLASRLEGAAVPGEILISHETYLLVRDAFDCVPKEPIQVKGFERPFQTYAVVGASEAAAGQPLSSSRTGFSLSLDPGNVPPEDRASVVEDLEAALERMR